MAPVNILLVSDSHGDRESLAYLKELYQDYDYLIHLGDSEMRTAELEGYLAVKGNHDSLADADMPELMILEVNGHRILVCHGHKEFIQYFKYAAMLEHAKRENCDTVFFGHVHVYQDTVQQGIRLLNPGSVYHNRDGTHPSYMLVKVDEEGIHAERMRYKAPSRQNEKPGWLERFLEKLAGRPID